ncbi:peptidase M48 family protein, partial [Vibrio parahaemolyticus VPTS-2010]
AKA